MLSLAQFPVRVCQELRAECLSTVPGEEAPDAMEADVRGRKRHVGAEPR